MARPNFLIFMSDHQRGDTVLPGHPAVTPHVDRLAREGVSFTQVYCPTPHCSPAKATFHTGLYPSRHGVWNNVGGGQALARGLKPGVRLWSEDLRDAGYELAFCGSWHVSAVESPADWGPTFLELAGVPVDRPFTGRSLAPLLRDEPVNDWRDEIHTQCNGVELYYTQRSVTTRRWKYVFNGFDDDELYDLSADPHEMHNLAGDAAPADVVRDMAGRMWRFACREGDTAVNDYITVALAPYGPAEAFRRSPAAAPGLQ